MRWNNFDPELFQYVYTEYGPRVAVKPVYQCILYTYIHIFCRVKKESKKIGARKDFFSNSIRKVEFKTPVYLLLTVNEFPIQVGNR